MSTKLASSNEFAALVNQLQQAPENQYHLKELVLKHLPQMKQWAQTNPLALYHLAHIYAPESPQYKKTMMQSADRGCINAMLAASKFLVKSTDLKDVQKAVSYTQKINNSGDTYLIDQANKLVRNYPQLAGSTQSHQKSNMKTGQNKHGFFAQQPTARTIEAEHRNTYQP